MHARGARADEVIQEGPHAASRRQAKRAVESGWMVSIYRISRNATRSAFWFAFRWILLFLPSAD